MKPWRIEWSRTRVETAEEILLVPDDWDAARVRRYALDELHPDDDGSELTWDDDGPERAELETAATCDVPPHDADHAVGEDGVEVPVPEEPLVFPGEQDWMEWRGRRWATNGHGLWREDAPPPGVRRRLWWRETVEDFDRLTGTPSDMPATWALVERDDQQRFVSGDQSRLVTAAYVVGLVDCEVCIGGPEDPVVFRRGGEVVAYVAPLEPEDDDG